MDNKSEKKINSTNNVTDENQITLTPMTVAQIAQKANKPVSEVILTLLKQGIVSTRNQVLSEKVVGQLAQIYGLNVIEKPKKPQAENTFQEKNKVAEEGTWQERMPVVVVIGHVDHGKTTLLDFIRKTRVAAKEKGGITQHLGAYEAHTGHGDIVFLDTPGHEAFSIMRMRGIRVADIAILVVAADDGVMPQTIEAIKSAKAVGLPIIVAINKIDKAMEQQLEVVKRQLAQHDLVPEEWGGSTVCVPISAKVGTGVSELLDVIILQSQLMDLKANISVPARGYVLESKLEKGRGPVATVICSHGVLKVGDYFIAGNTSGKVNSLVNSYGNQIKQIKPSEPAQVAGFSQLPSPGDVFQIVTQEEAKKGNIDQAISGLRSETFAKHIAGEATINIIIKADNASSKEALISSIDRLSSKMPKKFHIIYAGVGDIGESDVALASPTNSIIYGFHVKNQPSALDAISKSSVTIKHFNIIYKLLEDLELLAEAGKPVKMVSKKIGEALILKVFDIKGLGKIAGAVVKSGRFIKDGKVIVFRGKHKIGEGQIKGLQRERKAVKEVHTGFECAFLVDGFDAWEMDDRVECYQEVAA